MIFSMRILIKLTFFLSALAIFPNSVCAQDFAAMQSGFPKGFLDLEASQNKTLIIEMGALDGYVEGEYAEFFIQNKNYKYPRNFSIGSGELVKIFPKHSFWSIKVKDPSKFLAAEKMQLSDVAHVAIIRTGMAISGRPLDVKNRIRLLDRNERDYTLISDRFDQIPESLKKEHGYTSSENTNFEQNKLLSADINVSSNDYLQKKTKLEYSDEHLEELEEKYFAKKPTDLKISVEKNVRKEIVQDRAKVFENQNERMKYGSADFYREQKRVNIIRDVRDDISIQSVYKDAKENEIQSKFITNRARKKIERDGERWSEDMDAKTLRRYFVENGIEAEIARREKVLNELEGHEIWVSLSGGMNKNTNTIDQNYQRLDYSLSLGYDLHLARMNSDFSNWSIDFLVEKGVHHFAINDNTNAESQEIMGGLNLKYYYLNNPVTLNKIIGTIGVGVKMGRGNASGTELDRTYSYQIVSLPTMSAGFKYRVRPGDLTSENVNIGIAFSGGLEYERTNYSVNDSIANNAIYGSFAKNNLKYVMGIHFYY